MAYLKPSETTKIFNGLANRLAMRSTLWDAHTLEVAHRPPDVQAGPELSRGELR